MNNNNTNGSKSLTAKGEANMKYKTTAKAIKEGYNKIISCGYCDLQTLLSYESAVSYSSDYYGWNFDVYDVNGVAIATGYRGMPSKNSNAPYELVKEYESKAQDKTAEEKRLLLNEFVSKATSK